MTKFLYLLSVIVFYISNDIECSKIFDVLQRYYKSEAHERFETSWQLYHKAFETEIASNLQENFGRKAVNIYEPDRRIAHLIAGGFHLTDGVVMVYFFEMVLRELPNLVRPKLDMGLSANRVKFNSKLDPMFIDTTYYVARNSSAVIYARPEDQKELSPFSLQQVDNLGKVAIVAEDCLLSGLAIATLSGDSVNLGHSTFMLSDCKFTVEISTPNSGAPPVIAPYFPQGPKEKLEVGLSRPLRDELHTKLQGAMYSYINMTVLVGDSVANFRKSQQKLFKSYNEFTTNYVRDLNQKTLKANKGHVNLPNYEIQMNTETDKRRWQCHMALRNLMLYGLDTAYVAHTGGPYADEWGNRGSTRSNQLGNAADAIMFSSMQIRGIITHNDGNGSVTHDFAAELADVEVKIIFDVTERSTKMQDALMMGWRSLEFSIIPWETKYKERHGYQSLVYGHILNELPVLIIDHLRSILGESIKGSQQDYDGAGGGDAGNGNDANEGNDADEGNDEQGNDENESVADDDNGNTGKGKNIKEKNDGFFSDDLDENFFSDDGIEQDFFSDDGIDKDFISDDGIEKDFITDDGIEKDFITDDGIEKDFITDDGIEKDFISDDNVKHDFLTSDSKKSDDEVAAVDDTVNNEDVNDDGKVMDDGVAENVDPGEMGESVDHSAVTDDTVSNESVNDDNNNNVGAENAVDPGIGVGVDDEEVNDDDIGNRGISDNGEIAENTEGADDDDGKVSDNVEIAGPDAGVDDGAVEYNEGDKNVKGSGFLSEGFIEKDFFSDDNIKEDFISDMSKEDNDNNSPLVKNDNEPSVDNDGEPSVDNDAEPSVDNDAEPSVDNGDEVAVEDEDDGDGKLISADIAKQEKATGGDDDSVLDNDHLDKDFMSDALEENFFSDDKFENNFFSDDNTNLQNNDNIVNRVSGSPEDNNGEILDNADNTSINDNDNQNVGASGDKKLSGTAENIYSDDDINRRSMANNSQKGDTTTIDDTELKNPRNGEGDHVNDKLAATMEVDDKKPVNKEDNEKVHDSQKVHDPALPSNVHNARRQRNMHMSENEIR